MKKTQVHLSDHFTYKRLLRFCMPSIIMMVFSSIYGVVDGLFVSNFVGKNPFAAINLIMPVLMIIGGFGYMIGTGGSALVAKTLGVGDKDKANKYFTMLIIFTLILGVTVSVLGYIFIRPLSYLLGATNLLIEDCVIYGRITLIFNTAFMLQNVFQSFLATAERPKLGLVTIVAAGVANMILDALFIAVFDWGVAGAALATGVSQCIGGIIPLIYFLKKNTSLLKLVKTRLSGSAILKACANGSSELMSNVSASVISIVYNFQLLKLASENGVAAYGVLMYIQFIFIAVFFGYTIGTAPIIGYHFGAQNHAELKNLLKKSMLLTFLTGFVMMLLAWLLANPLGEVFVGYDRELFELTVHAFKLFAFAFVLAGMNIFISSFFTALNNGGISAAVSFLRTLVFQLIAVLALPVFFGLDGIWWAVSAAEVLAFFVSIIFLIVKRKKYHYM